MRKTVWSSLTLYVSVWLKKNAKINCLYDAENGGWD